VPEIARHCLDREPRARAGSFASSRIAMTHPTRASRDRLGPGPRAPVHRDAGRRPRRGARG